MNIKDFRGVLEESVLYFKKSTLMDSRFQPEFKVANEILNIINVNDHFSIVELESITSCLSSISGTTHFNGSMWKHFLRNIQHFIRSHGYEIDWLENEVALLIKINTVKSLIRQKNKGTVFFYNVTLNDEQNFTDLDLSNLIFQSCTFSCKFVKCDLRSTQFHNCNLSNSDFTRSLLVNAAMHECVVDDIILKSADVSNFEFSLNSHYGKIIDLEQLIIN